MYFLDALRVLRRRWYIVAVGALLVVAAGLAAIKTVPTSYQASGQMLLLLPADASGKSTPTNPYLNLQPGLTTTASLIAGNVTTKDTAKRMKAAGFSSVYSVALNPGTGPLLVITTKDTDPEMAVATRDEVMDQLDTSLSAIQSGLDVPPRQLIHAERSSVTNGAEVLPGSKIRALAGIAGAGTVLTLIVAFMLDRLLLRRAGRRAQRAQNAARQGRKSRPTDEPGEPVHAPRAQAQERPPPARALTSQVDPSANGRGRRDRTSERDVRTRGASSP